MNIFIGENRHLRKFFHQYAEHEAAIMNDLYERLPTLLTLHFPNINCKQEMLSI
ncbi:hypothetical protein [Photobacterium leiognathi]|uniref:hypothetical protein n=1 Tax=Photobacterium leiognathi TaxID=553611 RepID=UPI0027392C45|nr:hypothetical protein [Photobacterium leiognathi]